MGSSTVQAPTPAGAVAAAQAAALVGGLPALVFVSGQVDATTVADNIPLLPANPGQYFIGLRFSMETVSQTGTATTSLIFSMGNDAGHQNIVAQAAGTIIAAGLNATTGLTPIVGFISNLGGGGTLLDNAAPVVLKLVQAPAGITALKLRFFLYGTWISTAA